MSKEQELKTITVSMNKETLEKLGQEVMLRKQCGNMSMGIDFFSYAVICSMLIGKEGCIFWKVPGG